MSVHTVLVEEEQVHTLMVAIAFFGNCDFIEILGLFDFFHWQVAFADWINDMFGKDTVIYLS